MIREFRQFLFRGNIVDLAVAVVIGTAFVALVNAFIADILTPIVAAIFGKPDFSKLTFHINGSTFLYGDFLNALFTFPFMVNALEAGTVVAVLAAVVGWYMVLRRQNGGRAENGDLFAARDDLERGPQGDLRLAEPDIAANDPIHGMARCQVVQDVLNCFGLIDGREIRKARNKLLVL